MPRKSPRLLVALPLAVFGALGAIAASPPATGTARSIPACTATSNTIRSGQPNQTVNVRYSEEIGDSLSVTVAADSKLVVSSVRKGAAPMTAELLVNSEQGVPGDWNLTLTGKSGTCSGT